MPRSPRIHVGGLIYHVINRGDARRTIFRRADDYRAFEGLMAEAVTRTPMRLLAYCLMPNHWHLVLWPHQDGDLVQFMAWVTSTHSHRWHAQRGTLGEGHLYQARYKSFVIQEDAHFISVCRYIERNARRARLVKRAEHWQWCSLWRRRHPEAQQGVPTLTEWPVERPPKWPARVNQAETASELEAIRQSLRRSAPYGNPRWLSRMHQAWELSSNAR